MALRQHLLAKQLTAGIGLRALTERESLPDDVFHPETLECLSSDLALEGTCPVAYNEDAFRYFLDMERRRAEVSGRPLLLLLVDFKKQDQADRPIPSDTADQIFVALAACLRDTDFVGWYHSGRVIGAVLTQDTERPDSGEVDMVARRVTEALNVSLSASVSVRLQVRIYHLPSIVGCS
jgi:hypothetical protein